MSAMADLLVDVRCRGCRRLLGVGKKSTPVYCDVMCYEDYPASSTEARDALVAAVNARGEYTLDRLGSMFGFTRQRAQQILALRDIRKNA
jgi:hypothetical protein